jgi:hypothetical protein
LCLARILAKPYLHDHMNKLRLERTFASIALVALPALSWLWPADAGASTKLALDLNYAGGIDEPGIGNGTGGALRFGKELDLVAVSLTGELGLSYHTFDGELDPTHYGGFVGGRLAFGKILEPSIFAHVGVGRLNLDVAGTELHDTGPEFDVGLALDLTVLPLIDIGVHAMYDLQKLDDGKNFDWYKVGAHAALVF